MRVPYALACLSNCAVRVVTVQDASTPADCGELQPPIDRIHRRGSGFVGYSVMRAELSFHWPPPPPVPPMPSTVDVHRTYTAEATRVQSLPGSRGHREGMAPLVASSLVGVDSAGVVHVMASDALGRHFDLQLTESGPVVIRPLPLTSGSPTADDSLSIVAAADSDPGSRPRVWHWNGTAYVDKVIPWSTAPWLRRGDRISAVARPGHGDLNLFTTAEGCFAFGHPYKHLMRCVSAPCEDLAVLARSADSASRVLVLSAPVIYDLDFSHRTVAAPTTTVLFAVQSTTGEHLCCADSGFLLLSPCGRYVAASLAWELPRDRAAVRVPAQDFSNADIARMEGQVCIVDSMLLVIDLELGHYCISPSELTTSAAWIGETPT